jgi:CO/xanthine dehydrogenase Mo-binding subunit
MVIIDSARKAITELCRRAALIWRLQNPSFLDYRMPVASDVPMIDTEIVEVPNPRHPCGLRGVGDVPVTPAMAAIANAIGAVIGVLPMSPPKLLKLIEEARAGR